MQWLTNWTQSSRSVLSLFYCELQHGYEPTSDRQVHEGRRSMLDFFKVPIALFMFLLVGCLQCANVCLYMLTILPIRVLLGARVTRAYCADVVRALVLLTAICAIYKWIDLSMMYHEVRGQELLKLWVLYNMLDIGDRLLLNFGQDIFDAVHCTDDVCLWQPHTLLTFIMCFTLTTAYTVLHSLLILYQATALNVAFNSQNALLTVTMLSNNFSELKSAVFKKFTRDELFQVTCADVREWMHYLVLLAFVVVRNWNAASDRPVEMLPELIMLLLGELLIDWLKHAFLLKFNRLSYRTYNEFTVSIASDMLRGSRRSPSHGERVARRMAFVPQPLIVVVCVTLLTVLDWWNIRVLVITFSGLFVLKVLNAAALVTLMKFYAPHKCDD